VLGAILTGALLAMCACGSGHAQTRVAAQESIVSPALLGSTAGAPALVGAPFIDAGSDLVTATYRHLAMVVGLLAAVVVVAGSVSGRWLVPAVVRLPQMAQQMGQGDLTAGNARLAPKELTKPPYPMGEPRKTRRTFTRTPRRHAPEAQAVLDGMVEGVFVTDEDRVIVYANPQFMRTAPGGGSGAIGRFCGDVLHPNLATADRPCAKNCPILAARNRGVTRTVERLHCMDGTSRSTVIESASPFEGRQVHMLRDETEVEAARRARDSVLANISHEFRTPLAAHLAAIEMLRDGIATLDSSEQEHLLVNAESGALRLMRLIDNLLESVRVESGLVGLRHHEVDLEAIAQEATELVRPLLTQGELRVKCDLSALGDRAVAGDARRLQQVFVNLLSNAVKFAPRGTTIAIGGRLHVDQVQAWVEDEGPGVPSGDEAAIFGRFSRGGGAEPEQTGTGLGLWIVRSIVERHRGDVHVERTPDCKTRFVVTLPMAPGSGEVKLSGSAI
jgi:signal transduction histidine kinase